MREALSPQRSLRSSSPTDRPRSTGRDLVAGLEAEFDVELRGDAGERLRVVHGHRLLLGTEGHQPVQRTAVEKMKTELHGQAAGERALANAARAVDSDHRHLAGRLAAGIAHALSDTSMASPHARARSANYPPR